MDKNVKRFGESQIPEDYSRALTLQGRLIGPAHVEKVARVLFVGVTRALASIKDQTIPKAVVFKGLDGSFIAAAKIVYVKNDDSGSISSGQWSYAWTYNQEDVEDCQIVDVSSNSLIVPFFSSAALELESFVFDNRDTCILMMNLMLEMIQSWVRENTKEGNDITLILPGSFEATGSVEDGKIVVSIIPDGELKVLIKDDVATANVA